MEIQQRITDPDGNILYPTEEIQPIVDTLVYHLQRCFSLVEVCGFIRRGEKYTYDIGVVSIPNENIFSFSTMLANPPAGIRITDLQMKERKALFNVVLETGEKVHCDWHFLANEQEFEVMKLIRTGSQEFIWQLESEAKDKHLYLRHGGKYVLGKKTYVLWGLYGGYERWDDDAAMYQTIINPLGRRAWKEDEIIEMVFGHRIPPPDRVK